MRAECVERVATRVWTVMYLRLLYCVQARQAYNDTRVTRVSRVYAESGVRGDGERQREGDAERADTAHGGHTRRTRAANH